MAKVKKFLLVLVVALLFSQFVPILYKMNISNAAQKVPAPNQKSVSAQKANAPAPKSSTPLLKSSRHTFSYGTGLGLFAVNDTSAAIQLNTTESAINDNLSETSTASALAADTQAPTSPSGITVVSKTSTSIELSWTASTDNIGVTGYDIYTGATLAGSTTGSTIYTVTGLAPGTANSIVIKAKDAAGNVSEAGQVLNAATVGADGEMLYNPSFDVNMTGWCTWDPACATAVRDTVNYDSAPAGYRVECISPGTSMYSIQMENTNYLLYIVSGRKYRLTFRARATASFNIQAIALLKGATPYTSYATSQSAQITTGWQTYTVDYTANTTAGDAMIDFYLGKNMPVGTMLYIDSLSLKEVEDTQAPTSPSGITVLSKTSTSVELSWTASTDNVGVTGYDIYTGTTLAGSTTGSTIYNVTGLLPGTANSFTIRARNVAGNVSEASKELITATLGADGEMLYNSSFDENTAGWCTWDPGHATAVRDTENYDSAPAGYRVDCISPGTSKDSIQMENTNYLLYIVSGRKYRFTFRARTTASFSIQTIALMKGAPPYTGYATSQSVQITTEWQTYTIDYIANTTAGDAMIDFYLGKNMPAGAMLYIDSLSLKEVTDTQAPTTPSGLTMTTKTSTTVGLSWTASTDNAGVTGYDIYNGSIITGSTTGATIYMVKGLTPDMEYDFSVKAKDASGNQSNASNTATVRTSKTEVIKLSAQVVDNSIIVKWNAINGVSLYDIEVDGIVIDNGTNTTYAHTGLQPNIRHTYRVRTRSVNGNSEWSEMITCSLNNTDYFVSCIADKEYVLALDCANIADFNGLTLNFTYNSSEFEIVDLSSFTKTTELAIGLISGTEVEVVEFTPGIIKYKIHKTIPAGGTWTGIVNTIRVKSKHSGTFKLSYGII